VEGKNGLPALWNKMKVGGPGVLFHGAIASSVATMIGHFPWFFTFNYLDATIPRQVSFSLGLYLTISLTMSI